jgi:hypothetical protein
MKVTMGTRIAGKTILELMWEDLDNTMDLIMDDNLAWEGDDYENTRGRASGVAWCIALVSNPYVDGFEGVRELAVERWQQRQDGTEMTPLRTSP